MLVFIDESGDCGMKVGAGSSRLFLITAILFEDSEDAEDCDGRIAELRKDLQVHERFEFHFNRCCDKYRTRFLEAVSGSQFFYYSMVLNKAKLWGEGFKYKDSFYKYAAGLVFENTKARISNATVVLDKCGDREFRDQLARYLKKRMNDRKLTLIKKLRMEPSHSNSLLQLADMVCGAVYRSFDINRRDRMAFRKLVGHREMEVRVWPR